MIYTIEISKQADIDLRNIYEYIAFSLLLIGNAAGQLKRLEDGIMGLKQMPERFREYDKEPWRSRGMRWMPIDNYIVYYIPNKKMGIVTIIRVIYAGRDIEKQLSENTIL